MDERKLWRLAECMRRAAMGEKMTVGFLGGSITQGSAASSPESCYAYRVYDWWRKRFPQAEPAYVNAGIGGTGSHFGAARAEEDLLIYQPDVVVIDFSVNDCDMPFFQETFEGVLRRVLNGPSQPAVLVLNNVFYDTGVSAQEEHNAVAEHYGVPWVSIRDTVWRRMREGAYSREELTSDGLHPGDRGHELVAAEVIRVLEEARAFCGDEAKEKEAQAFCGDEPLNVGMPEKNKMPEVSTTDGEGTRCETEVQCSRPSEKGRGAISLPAPLTVNAYEHARRMDIRTLCPCLRGFRVDTTRKAGYHDFFRNGWIGWRAGDRLEANLECSCLAVQYRRTVRMPALSARLVLDGQEESAVLLDGSFDEDWGDCLALKPVLHHGKMGVHQVTVEIVETEEENAAPFYLLAFIVA